MFCLSDNHTMAFEDQSTIPKATFIEIGVYHVVMRLLSRYSTTPPSSAPLRRTYEKQSLLYYSILA